MYIKEVPVESLQEAFRAEALGAGRIELCDNLHAGGTTPSCGTIRICKELLRIPFTVMIRPRCGNFIYTKEEIEIMKEDIRICRESGVYGIVTGVLTENREVNEAAMDTLIRLARPLRITFHKAIDETKDPLAALEQLISLGIDRVLTSGCRETAREGSGLMNEMIRRAGGKIIVMPSGKITKENLGEIRSMIPAPEYHGRLIVGPVDG